MVDPYKDVGLYIAGPECFYARGYDLWWAQRKLAEYYGFSVVLPTDTRLKLDNPDLRLNAKEIFDDLKVLVTRTTAIIADLEFFRGCEPDGGTVFEIGMIYAKHGRCYGYTRDMRPMVHKNQGARLRDGVAVDQEGWEHPYGELPFCPSLIGSTKIVEGGFEDCLQTMMRDIDEERKNLGRRVAVSYRADPPPEPNLRPLVFLSGPQRYSPAAAAYYADAKEKCASRGLDAICPLDDVDGVPRIESEDPYVLAAGQLDRCQAMVRRCDAILADLSDFHGLEPNNDVSFECGMAFQLGKKLVGFMQDTRRMRERIPHYGADREYKDICGNNVENFDYPINLMFACSMEIVEGDLEKALGRSSMLP
jgi:nucleoside 2-deoxyribosyltransferase